MCWSEPLSSQNMPYRFCHCSWWRLSVALNRSFQSQVWCDTNYSDGWWRKNSWNIHTHTLTDRWPHHCLQSEMFYSPGLHSTQTGVRIHFHPHPPRIIFSSQAIVNNSGCFPLCRLAVNALSNLCQSCHHQTLSCDAAKTAYHVRGWPWEFWKFSLMFNLQYLCMCVCLCVCTSDCFWM